MLKSYALFPPKANQRHICCYVDAVRDNHWFFTPERRIQSSSLAGRPVGIVFRIAGFAGLLRLRPRPKRYNCQYGIPRGLSGVASEPQSPCLRRGVGMESVHHRKSTRYVHTSVNHNQRVPSVGAFSTHGSRSPPFLSKNAYETLESA